MITPFLLYLLKVNIAIAIFYAFYALIVKRETFYTCNRIYFLSVLAVSAIFPLVNFSMFFPAAKPLMFLPQALTDIDMELTNTARHWILSDYIVLFIALGATVLVLRFGVQLISLIHLYKKSRKNVLFNKNVRVIAEKATPFSFFKWIFVNPRLHKNKDLYEIVMHENAHVQQWHSIDIVLFELAAACCWYNPFIWLMRKAMKQNIEFLADKQALKAGCDKRHYQYNLLKVSNIAVVSSIVNNFTFSDLKGRIAMMNKKQSANSKLLKYTLIIPVFVTAAVLVNASPQLVNKTLSGNNEYDLVINNVLPGNTIVFDKDVHDFGTISESNGKVSTIFTFTNTGNTPIIINNVTASCGCTAPEWVKDPIPPGGQGIIRTTYDPAGRVYPFNRALTVHCNVEPYNITLHVRGMVIK